MFSNFIVAVSAVVPIFVLIGIGLLVQRAHLLTKEELAHTNRLVFRVFFFFTLFSNIYNADFADGFNPRLMLFGAAAVTLLFLGGLAFSYLFEPLRKRRGAMTQAIFRSNFIILGLPLVVNIFGEDGALVPTMMVAVIIPLYNIYAVLALETFRGGTFRLLPILRGVLKNPMIDGMLLGFRGVEFVTLLAIFATPCAVASYAMAQQMGSDAALAGNTVVFTSALSCFTIFGWIFLTKTLGLF